MINEVKLIECPRDAMQGINNHFISTDLKIKYINSLLKVGFDTIDFGSFVSHKSIPQMRDTANVISKLDLSTTKSNLLAIVANVRGANDACKFEQINYLGYPFSISETFQMRNTHKTISQSVEILKKILHIADKNNKKIVTYLSMGFGNPYGEPWNIEIVEKWTNKLVKMGVKIISLSDTIGSSTPDIIKCLFSTLIPKYSKIEFGAHIHTSPLTWYEKLDSAFKGGCKRFDSVIRGYGGCPMAKNELTVNMPTEKLLSYFSQKKIKTNINPMSFESAYNKTLEIFKK